MFAKYIIAANSAQSTPWNPDALDQLWGGLRTPAPPSPRFANTALVNYGPSAGAGPLERLGWQIRYAIDDRTKDARQSLYETDQILKTLPQASSPREVLSIMRSAEDAGAGAERGYFDAPLGLVDATIGRAGVAAFGGARPDIDPQYVTDNVLGGAAGFIPAARGASALQRGVEFGPLGRANFAQKTFGPEFDEDGPRAGQLVGDVAERIARGQERLEDLPIDFIDRGDDRLILNTRSSQALTKAGVPRGDWVNIDRTGEVDYEDRLADQLTRNKLTNSGTPTTRPKRR